MSVQVTLGNFAELTPPTGSIKVLYKDQNGVSNIRALTISNVDLDGNNVQLSLDALEQIRIFLGGQAPLTRTQLDALSRAAKPRTGGRDYYYIDVQDLFLSNGQQISGSDSSYVNITPYLPQPFFNNDYNALISNADTIRTSNFRYDVDRAGGLTYPTNYEAIAGIAELPFTDLKFNNYTTTETTQSAYTYTVSSNVSGSVTNYQTLLNDEDLNIRVDLNTIIDSLSTNPGKLIEPLSVGEDFEYEFTSTLTIEIAAETSFNPNGSRFSSSSLAVQTNKNGYIDTTFTPYERRITSGSFSGNDIYVRLKQTNTVESIDSLDVNLNIKSFLYNSPKLSKNLLSVRGYYDIQEPYADLAPVQDSNYNHTGHTNARYNGSKTTELDYSGLSPAMSAKPLEAALYNPNENNDIICSQSLSDRAIEEVFFEGTTELPEVGIETVAYLNDPISNTTQTEIILQGISGIKISAGDIIELYTEQMLVLSVQQSTFPATGLPKFTLQVQRQYNSTTAQASYSPGTFVRRLSGARLFKFNRNRPVAISNKKIWIKENRTIVKTNDRGFVVELSATCSV